MVLDGAGRAPPLDWHRLTVRVGGGGYLMAVGGHPHWIGIGSQYAWGGGVLDGGGRAPPLDWHRLTVRVGGGGSGRRWEGTPIGLA